MLLPGKMEGIGRFTYEIFSRIVKEHPEAEFHFYFDRPFHKAFIFSGNVFPHVVPPPARHPYLMRIWYDITWPAFLKRVKPDIVISPDAQCSLTTSFPQIIVIHDINFEHYPEDIPGVYYRDLKRRTPRFCRKADKIVTVSEFSAGDIAECYGLEKSEIGVVYNGAGELYRPLSDEEKYKARAEFAGGSDYFITVGSIHPRKNLQRLIPAFLDFKKRTGSDTKLLLVGQTFWKNRELHEVMDQAMQSGEIIFAGRLEGAQLAEAVGAAKASLYVSYFEGFGIPIVEAFSAGVPVITSNVTSMPEVAGNAALYVDPFSTRDICAALAEIDADEHLRRELVSKGKDQMEKFDWDQSARKFWRIIEHTLDHVRKAH